MENTNTQAGSNSFMSPTIAKLSEALSKAQGEFDHAKKDVKNEFFKSKYADLASVIDAAKKPLSNNGLAVIQITEVQDNGDIFLTTLLTHSSGEWIISKYPIKPMKPDPQGFGSALTYARRYSFSAITGIASEDDDGNAGAGNPSVSSQSQQSYAQFKPGSTFNAGGERKVTGTEILAQMNACENSDELTKVKNDYKQDINRFKISKNPIDKEFYEQIVARGQELADAFIKIELNDPMPNFGEGRQ